MPKKKKSGLHEFWGRVTGLENPIGDPHGRF